MASQRVARTLMAGAWLFQVAVGGCVKEERIEPVRLTNGRIGPVTIAVAPALNQSGSTDFDPDRFADLMASELSFAEGVTVIPVSRLLGVLAEDHRDGVESPEHAISLLDPLGADAILVFAVTEYDPYFPPTIGITAQLYGARAGQGSGATDPIALSRSAALTGDFAPRAARGLLSQTQRVFDASHDWIERDVKDFAARRRGDRRGLGWRKFVVSQQNYIRFCCNSTISQLLGWPDDSVLADGDPREVRKP
ncbi:MAG: hypothetical protein ACYTHJ_23015 [Planctomycetota bacterium]|jgi:hypothetical protein